MRVLCIQAVATATLGVNWLRLSACQISVVGVDNGGRRASSSRKNSACMSSSTLAGAALHDGGIVGTNCSAMVNARRAGRQQGGRRA